MVMCGDVKLDIRGKDFEVLHLLLRHPKRLVRKETFLREIWPDVDVEEASIPVCISNIREKLGMHSERHLIETVRGLGYRLLVDVIEVDMETRQFDVQPETEQKQPDRAIAQNENEMGEPHGVVTNDSGLPTGKIWDKVESALTEVKNLVASLQQDNIELKEKLELEKEAYRKLKEDFKHRLGHRARQLEIRMRIENYEGDCHCRWIWTDITDEPPDTVISRLYGSVYFSTPGCSFKQYPTLSANTKRGYKLEIVTKGTALCDFYVYPPEGIDSIYYEYIADANKAFCMSAEELEKMPYEYEWFGFHITVAIETLTIKVTFPEHYRPDYIQADAYLGFFPTNVSDVAEIDRININNWFKKESSEEFTLTVIKPKMGYKYCVRWKPLPGQLVDAMKEGNSPK
jgi:DNA-binding winged helix-turn-helix (wHTH) protein